MGEAVQWAEGHPRTPDPVPPALPTLLSGMVRTDFHGSPCGRNACGHRGVVLTVTVCTGLASLPLTSGNASPLAATTASSAHALSPGQARGCPCLPLVASMARVHVRHTATDTSVDGATPASASAAGRISRGSTS